MGLHPWCQSGSVLTSKLFSLVQNLQSASRMKQREVCTNETVIFLSNVFLTCDVDQMPGLWSRTMDTHYKEINLRIWAKVSGNGNNPNSMNFAKARLLRESYDYIRFKEWLRADIQAYIIFPLFLKKCPHFYFIFWIQLEEEGH